MALRLPRIIGIAGLAGSGKDSTACCLMEYGYERVALADPLKAMATVLGWDGSKEVLPPCPCCGMIRGRELLQKLGTDAVREHLGRDTWVRALEARTQAPHRFFVVPDVRFPDEAHAIYEWGGEVWRVERPSVDTAMSHASESHALRLPAREVIVNDGTLTDLCSKVRAIVERRS